MYLHSSYFHSISGCQKGVIVPSAATMVIISHDHGNAWAIFTSAKGGNGFDSVYLYVSKIAK